MRDPTGREIPVPMMRFSRAAAFAAALTFPAALGAQAPPEPARAAAPRADAAGGAGDRPPDRPRQGPAGAARPRRAAAGSGRPQRIGARICRYVKEPLPPERLLCLVDRSRDRRFSAFSADCVAE